MTNGSSASGQSRGNEKDVKPKALPDDLDWSAGKATESLTRLYCFVNEACEEYINWYIMKKPRKKKWAYLLRIAAIFAVTAAGIIPVLAEIETFDFSPAWSTVLLAVAAVFYSLDKFVGCTSGWIRYIRTQTKLAQLQADFRLKWQVQMCEIQNSLKTSETSEEGETKTACPEPIKNGIALCSQFLNKVYEVVVAETDQWAEEFKAILKDLEKQGGRNT